MSATGWTLVAVLALGSPVLAGPYDPALRFLTHRTPHFQIHYHRGEEALAARLASIAEATHVRLSSAWALPDARMTHVVLVDQTDLSNGIGHGRPVERHRHLPGAARAARHHRQHRRLARVRLHARVRAHPASRSVARLGARWRAALFGRSAIAFPESHAAAVADRGAGHADRERGRRRAVCTRATSARSWTPAARARRLEPLDRVNGGLVDWPSGQGWYAYGARFHQYLADLRPREAPRTVASEPRAGCPFSRRGRFGRSTASRWASCGSEFQAAARGGDCGFARRIERHAAHAPRIPRRWPA